MSDQTSKRVELAPNLGAKEVMLVSGTTITPGTSTLTLNLADFGINRVLSVQGFTHTTDYSVIVADSGTSAVSNGVLTWTTGLGNTNKRRVVVVRGE